MNWIVPHNHLMAARDLQERFQIQATDTIFKKKNPLLNF